MADTAKRIVGPIALTNAAATVYTVPGATTTTVRSIHINNETANARTVTVSIGADGAGKRFLGPGLTIPANGSYDWSGFEVLAATEVLQANSDAGAALTMTASGIETA